jgi:hypothetical protein
VCIFHGPPEEAAAARQRGRDGQAAAYEARKASIGTVDPDELPAGGAPPQTLADVATWFSWLTVQLATGRVDYRIGREIGHALTGYRTALEKKELSAKVGDLQAKLAAATARRRGGAGDGGGA